MQTMQHQQSLTAEGYTTPPDNHTDVDRYGGTLLSHQLSPSPVPKNVSFELLLDENSKVRARIPMRVQIYPHDATDSIVTTVKNFYGIYDGVASGVSFEDEHGTTLIARYENLRNNMTVYVRVIPVHGYAEGYEQHYYDSAALDAQKRPSLGEPFQMVPPLPAPIDFIPPPSRPMSRARRTSTSPSGRGRRSASQNKGPTKVANKSRGSSAHGSFNEELIAAYSDSEGGHGSVNGSKKARSEPFASSEISMENIVQESRRKRPKFESSELPLFVPPQVPLATSTSSISPQRRSTGQDGEPSPFARPAQRPFNTRPPLPSPQSFGYNEQVYGNGSTRNSVYSTPIFPEQGTKLRERYVPPTYSNSGSRQTAPGILPTPDPTIASCISDEDVAMQLIRLGDVSNFSHGRNSASTLDDAFSGAADASSTGATSDGDFSENEEDDELPTGSRQRRDSSPLLPPGQVKRAHKQLDDILPSYDSTDLSGDEGGEEYHRLKNEYDEDDTLDAHGTPRAKKQKTNFIPSKARSSKSVSSKNGKIGKIRNAAIPRKPKAAASMPAGPKVAPPVQMHQLAVDEEDLSTKPRCQRCRKSKKGCDRQRPCGRCKDAGIGMEGCVSEDEGNGRKGRYGRHMGVPVKKTLEDGVASEEPEPSVPALAPPPIPSVLGDKNKKRKR